MSPPTASDPNRPVPEEGRVLRSQSARAPEPSTAQAPEVPAPPATPANDQSITITPEALLSLVDRAARNQTAQSGSASNEVGNRSTASDKLSLDRFSGRPEEARTWLTRLEILAGIERWGEERRLVEFAKALKDDAVDWFVTLPEATQGSWPALEEAFRSRYCLISSRAEAVKAFKELRQGPSEDVGRFVQRFKALIAQTKNEHMIDEMKVDHFLDKLRPEIRDTLDLFQPLSLEENIKRAAFLELRTKTAQHSSNSQAPPSVYYPSPPSLSPPSLSPTPSLASRDDTTIASIRGGYACWFCQQPGHTWHQCNGFREFAKKAGDDLVPVAQRLSTSNAGGRGRGRRYGARRGRGGRVNAQTAEVPQPTVESVQYMPSPATTAVTRAPTAESWDHPQWPGNSVNNEAGTPHQSATNNPFAQAPPKN